FTPPVDPARGTGHGKRRLVERECDLRGRLFYRNTVLQLLVQPAQERLEHRTDPDSVPFQVSLGHTVRAEDGTLARLQVDDQDGARISTQVAQSTGLSRRRAPPRRSLSALDDATGSMRRSTRPLRRLC